MKSFLRYTEESVLELLAQWDKLDRFLLQSWKVYYKILVFTQKFVTELLFLVMKAKETFGKGFNENIAED